jgi:hypothetical protein
VGIDRGCDLLVERIGRRKIGASVVGQRRIDRQRACGGMADKAIQPCFRDEVEQGGGRDQVLAAVEHALEIAVEIERNGIQPDIAGSISTARQRQQMPIAVDEIPVLPHRQM